MKRLLVTLRDWAGLVVLLVGLAVCWALDRAHALAGRADEHGDY